MTFAFEFKMLWGVTSQMFQSTIRKKSVIRKLVRGRYRSRSFTAGFRLFFTTTSSSIWIGEPGRLVVVVETRRDGTAKSVSICGGRVKSSASKSISL
jgi:hypothetical protein